MNQSGSKHHTAWRNLLHELCMDCILPSLAHVPLIFDDYARCRHPPVKSGEYDSTRAYTSHFKPLPVFDARPKTNDAHEMDPERWKDEMGAV